MKKYDSILFDLDGTLTDPKLGITKSVQYSLSKFGIDIQNLDELEKFIGPPLYDSFPDFYNFSKEDTEKAVNYFREYFSDNGIFENSLYDGIDKLLSNIKESGVKLYVATSKPEVFAKKIIDYFNLGSYFTSVYGSKLNGELSNKRELIKHILIETGCNPSKTLMIGDRKHDVIGASSNSIDSLGVLYGYSKGEELKEAGATYIVSNIEELGEFFALNIYA